MQNICDVRTRSGKNRPICIEGSLALSHKKNPRIFGRKTAGFFPKNVKTSMSVPAYRGNPFDFKEFLTCTFCINIQKICIIID